MLSKILKRFFCVIMLFLVFGCKKSSTKSVGANIHLQDSISYYIQSANDFSKSEKQIIQQLSRAERLTEEQDIDSLYITNKYYIGFIYDNIGQHKKFKTIVDDVIRRTIKINDSLNLARGYAYLGEYYTNTLKMDSAVIYFHQAEKIFLKFNDNARVGRMQIKMATAKFKERDYIGSEKSAVLALNNLRLANDKLLEYEAYNLLGITCIEIKDYDKAKEYFERAFTIAEKEQLEELGQYQSKAITLNNLGLVNLKSEKYAVALNYFKQAIKNPNLIEEHPSLYAIILTNIGTCNTKLENFSSLPNDFHVALKIRQTENNIPQIIDSYLALSEYYHVKNQNDSARYYANNGFSLSKESKILNLQLQSISQLRRVEPEKENIYSKIYITLSDSLIASERKSSEKFARIEFETDEFRRQKEQLAIQNRNIIIFTLFAFFIGALLFVIRFQRNRNTQLQMKEAQQKANEEIYNLMLSQQKKLDEVIQKEKQRIAQELHDGVLGRLFGARLNLDSLNKKDDPKAIESRNHYISELKTIEQDIREISHELNREKYALINNFVTIITNLFEEQKTISEAKLTATIDSSINWSKIDNTVKINLYRIIQESFQNINKYAKATTILVSLEKDKENLKLLITDDGIGFDVTKKSKGIGIQNIEARVKACHGKFEITSSKGAGTTIKISLLMEQNQVLAY
jgi:signal transduction histidine kinase/Tfp pilus assembly protein PilF